MEKRLSVLDSLGYTLLWGVWFFSYRMGQQWDGFWLHHWVHFGGGGLAIAPLFVMNYGRFAFWPGFFMGMILHMVMQITPYSAGQ